jgi:hypothetical protein
MPSSAIDHGHVPFVVAGADGGREVVSRSI